MSDDESDLSIRSFSAEEKKLSFTFADRSFIACNGLAERKTIFCSEEFVNMFGYSKAEVLATNRECKLEFLQVSSSPQHHSS